MISWHCRPHTTKHAVKTAVVALAGSRASYINHSAHSSPQCAFSLLIIIVMHSVVCDGMHSGSLAVLLNAMECHVNLFIACICLSTSVFVKKCCLLSFDAVGWAAGRASGLQKTEWWGASVVICLE